MAKKSKLALPSTVGPSDDYQAQDDANTMFRHHKLMSDKPRATAALNMMKGVIDRNQNPENVKSPAGPAVRGLLKVPKLPKVRGAKRVTSR